MNGARARPIRVLYLVHWLNRGGIECSLLAALRHMNRARCELDVAYKGPCAGELASAARATGAKLLHCPLTPSVLPFTHRLQQILQCHRYDLLHVHIDAHAGPAVWAAKRAGVPAITSYHNTSHPPETWLTSQFPARWLRSTYAMISMRYAFIHSRLVTGVSQAVVDAIQEQVRVRRADSRVLYSGIVEPRVLTPDEKVAYRAQLRLSAEQPVLLHVGSFSARKNHLGLLEVFRRIVDRLPNTVLILVGDGLLRPRIEQRIGELKLTERVRMLGTRSDVTAIMQLSNLLLFPSVTEGLGWVLVEAGATRLPVIASDIEPIREATHDGASARLHAVTDLDGMASSALELLKNPAEGRRLGETGRSIYEQTFSVQASVDRLMTLYADALRTPEPRSSVAA
jgi:glycosyltransferase involved in cell wall biosynthesis